MLTRKSNRGRTALVALAASTALLSASSALAGVSDEIAGMVACQPGQKLAVYVRGTDDGFSASEVTSPRPELRQTDNLENYHDARPELGPIRAYDDPRQNTWFIDTFTGLPGANIASGMFMISMRNPGHNDNMHIGDVAGHFDNGGQQVFGERVNMLAWSKMGDTYYARLGDIDLRDTTTLLQYLNANTVFDVSVQDDTEVDFTGLVLCVEPPRPTGVVAQLEERLRCERGMRKQVIMRGSDTDGYVGMEPPTPRPALQATDNLTDYHGKRPHLGGPRQYDDMRQNAWFIETLSGYPTNAIADGYFAIGMKNFGHNDSIHIGDVAGAFDGVGQRIFGKQANQIGWSTMGAGNAYVAQLSQIPLNSGESLLTYVNSAPELDISVQDDTAVDFTALVFCAKEGYRPRPVYGAGAVQRVAPVRVQPTIQMQPAFNPVQPLYQPLPRGSRQ